MKFSELQRLTLENIHLKIKMIENDFINLQKEMLKLREAHEEIVKGFCEEHNLDPTKININLQTGEVILLQGGENAELVK